MLFNSRKTLFIIIALLTLAGCHTYPPYRYSFSLVDPYTEELKYEDEYLSFQFSPTAEYIWVSIRNKSEEGISFDRDKAEYINTLGEAHPILFGWRYGVAMNEYINQDRFLGPLRIDPGTEREGNIWINIWPGPGGTIGEWTTISETSIECLYHNMLPGYVFEGNGYKLKDTTFVLILPFEFDTYTRNYEFTFMITNVGKGALKD